MMRTGEPAKVMALRIANMVQADFAIAVDSNDPRPRLLRNMIVGALLAFRDEVLYEAAKVCDKSAAIHRAHGETTWAALEESRGEEIRELSSEQRCRVCGCTEAKACEGGCSWFSMNLCTSCSKYGTSTEFKGRKKR